MPGSNGEEAGEVAERQIALAKDEACIESALLQLRERYAAVLDQLKRFPSALTCLRERAREGLWYAESLVATLASTLGHTDERAQRQEVRVTRLEREVIAVVDARGIVAAMRVVSVQLEMRVGGPDFASKNRACSASLADALDALEQRQRMIRQRLPIQTSHQVDEVLPACIESALRTVEVHESVEAWKTTTRRQLLDVRTALEERFTHERHALFDATLELQ
ncbi:hypothetical protein HDZ31DRAFT_39585 [Schizophyllum fasciatum]